jgi:hypothetical protein
VEVAIAAFFFISSYAVQYIQNLPAASEEKNKKYSLTAFILSDIIKKKRRNKEIWEIQKIRIVWPTRTN